MTQSNPENMEIDTELAKFERNLNDNIRLGYPNLVKIIIASLSDVVSEKSEQQLDEDLKGEVILMFLNIGVSVIKQYLSQGSTKNSLPTKLTPIDSKWFDATHDQNPLYFSPTENNVNLNSKIGEDTDNIYKEETNNINNKEEQTDNLDLSEYISGETESFPDESNFSTTELYENLQDQNIDTYDSSESLGAKNIYTCDQCNHTSSNRVNLKMHVNTVHLKIKNHSCEECGHAFAQAGSLKLHMKAVHSQIKDHQCEECEYTTSSRAYLALHVKSVHMKIKDNKCTKCDYASSLKHSLKGHYKRVHTNIKDYKCPHCNYASVSRTSLNSHERRIHQNGGRRGNHLKRTDHS